MRSIHAISTVESMEVGTYHFTWVPTPQFPTMIWMLKLLHGNTFWTCVARWVELKAGLNSKAKFRYHIENLVVRKHGFSSSNWTNKLKMGKTKLETLDVNMRVWKLFEVETTSFPYLYISIRVLQPYT